MSCPDCGERMAHCHGTLVLHTDVVECTDPGCATPQLASHALVASCGEVGCTSPLPRDSRSRSAALCG